MKLIADNLRITQAAVAAALRSHDPTPVRDLVERCVARGAFAIDVNTGPLTKAPEAAGVSKEQIIIDPVVPPLAWEDGIAQARVVVNVIKTLPDLLGFPVQTIAGVSNLTSGATDKAKKNLVEQSYLAMLAGAGLEFALMDILNDELVTAARASSILARETLFSWGMVP